METTYGAGLLSARICTDWHGIIEAVMDYRLAFCVLLAVIAVLVVTCAFLGFGDIDED